jgi:peroxiredoxin Q/BCP
MKLLFGFVLVFAMLAGSAFSANLKVGDKAPDFKLRGSDGQVYELSAMVGKTVVLAWFVKAFTGG